MKLTTTALKRANAIMLMLLLTAIMPSCESEQDRKDEAMREELRSAIGVIEKNQQAHLAVQREFVELHEKLKLKPFALGTKPPTEREREKLERSEQEYGNGWQDDMREKIDEASGEELKRVFLELRGIGERADMGKTFTASALRSLRQRQKTPAKDRLF